MANVSISCSSPCPDWLAFGNWYIQTGIGVAGVVGNVLILLTLARDVFARSPYTFMTGIALLDLVNCVLTVPMGLLVCRCYTRDQKIYKDAYRLFVFLPLVNVFATSSVWTTLTLSVERLVAIGRPLYVTDFKVRLLMPCLFFVAFVLHAPLFFAYSFDHKSDKYRPTDFKLSAGFAIYMWVRTILCKFLPIAGIVGCSVMLFLVVRSARRRHSIIAPGDCGSARGPTHATKMLMATNAIYVVCHVMEPLTHRDIFSAIFGDSRRLLFIGVQMVSNILELFSFASNIVPYYFFNSLFRHALCLVLRCRPLARVAADDIQLSNCAGRRTTLESIRT